ncbi:hypothetical protein [Alkalihalobacillus pseudalcaliphilus]|uniref:hypothetical protein n=1 Tax=Alkalihalobacillus pseudalcaliphilus TaxID=79884 RepID=UPI00064E0621|nr:hypothetical protein [Alkalihalobacillus pseudalcaliphilus]KMK75542.1 hypothetical protein AB990_09600 [Alkalihalobacillus pseudalcaliphilus]
MDRKKAYYTLMIGSIAHYILYYLLVFSVIVFDYKTLTIAAIILIVLPFVIFILFAMFLSRLLVKSGVNKRSNKKLISLSVIAPLFCLICLGIFVERATFSSEKWVSEPSERVMIIDNFLHNTELIGKSLDEIVSLLGDPDENGYFADDMTMVYYLGPERSFISIDSEWLVISIEDNKAQHYEIRTD